MCKRALKGDVVSYRIDGFGAYCCDAVVTNCCKEELMIKPRGKVEDCKFTKIDAW